MIRGHVDPPDHFDPLNIADALEKFAASINKTRDELDENERKQAVMNAVLAQGEKLMPKSILYKMYAADTIKLVKATLQGTTTPMVPFNVDPLEFCREAHKVKDELVGSFRECWTGEEEKSCSQQCVEVCSHRRRILLQ